MSLPLPDGRPGRAEVVCVNEEKLAVMGEWSLQREHRGWKPKKHVPVSHQVRGP